MDAWVERIASSALSGFVLDNGWFWPFAEALHFMGLVLLVGTVGLFDLRVLGVGKGLAPSAVHRLVPLGLGGFAISVATGVLFVAGMPDQYFYNAAFAFKLVFLLAMGLNAAVFYSRAYRFVAKLGPGDDAPAMAKGSAALSLAFMAGVMYCGRMLTFFRPPGWF